MSHRAGTSPVPKHSRTSQRLRKHTCAPVVPGRSPRTERDCVPSAEPVAAIRSKRGTFGGGTVDGWMLVATGDPADTATLRSSDSGGESGQQLRDARDPGCTLENPLPTRPIHPLIAIALQNGSSTPLPPFRRFLAALCACLLPVLALVSSLHSHPHPSDSSVPHATTSHPPESAPDDSDDESACGLCQFLHGFQPPTSPHSPVVAPGTWQYAIAFSPDDRPYLSAYGIRPPERAPPASA